jgi:hypothetical protein
MPLNQKGKKARNADAQLKHRRSNQSNRAILKALCNTLGLKEVPFAKKPDKAHKDKTEAFNRRVAEIVNELLGLFEVHINVSQFRYNYFLYAFQTKRAQQFANIDTQNQQYFQSEMANLCNYVPQMDLTEGIYGQDYYSQPSFLGADEVERELKSL